MKYFRRKLFVIRDGETHTFSAATRADAMEAFREWLDEYGHNEEEIREMSAAVESIEVVPPEKEITVHFDEGVSITLKAYEWALIATGFVASSTY